MIRFLLILFLFSLSFIDAQNYKHVDSIVATYPGKFQSIEKLANKISSDFKTNIDKTRAAYYWTANHVSYDFKDISNSRDVNYTTNEQLERIQKNYAEKVLRRKIAVCEGYSQLLKFTLNHLNIQCEVVSGYAKTTIRDIGRITKDSNHAWNAVYIHKKWQLIDATWSTGNDEDKHNVFEFDDSYFLIKPKLLIWSHFPENKKWQLLDNPISVNAFFYAPIIHHGFYNSGLNLSKMSGVIKSDISIEISFNTINKNKTYYFVFEKQSAYSKPIKFIEKDGKYITVIPFKKGIKDELIIFSNKKACLSFKII